MQRGWWRPLVASGIYYGISELIKRGDQGKGRLRLVVFGLVWAGLALMTGWIGLGALALALFFSLADWGRLWEPALITGGIALGLSGLLAWRGWIMLRAGR